eukprot:TRINITY_DN1365_c0_g1_i2.p5 TRINITY_DN1365_c0_g1~~TRINITY_DN1365_c0_g1_i2.p5  ORF type:complete len:54 (-),score=7.68 TRINITY_DN1365_c0_g1_i2:65-226(-)
MKDEIAKDITDGCDKKTVDAFVAGCQRGARMAGEVNLNVFNWFDVIVCAECLI